MMKQIVIFVIVFFVGLLLFFFLAYGVIGFTKMEFNPKNWTEGERFVLSFMGGVLGVVVSGGLASAFLDYLEKGGKK